MYVITGKRIESRKKAIESKANTQKSQEEGGTAFKKRKGPLGEDVFHPPPSGIVANQQIRWGVEVVGD